MILGCLKNIKAYAINISVLLSFNKKVNRISEIYLAQLKDNGYLNALKLHACMKFWLKIFFISRSENVKISTKRLDILSDSTVEIKKNKPHKKKISEIIFNLFSKFKIRKGLLIYGYELDSRIGLLIHLITSYKLKNVKTSLNASFKAKYFSEIKKVMDKATYVALKNGIPDNFFFNMISDSSLPKIYRGSMYTLFTNENNFKILLQKDKIKAIGLQHGGCYGELPSWNTEIFEKEVSDIFFHWGLGINNIRQNKFSVIKKKTSSIKRLYFVGTPDIGLVDLNGTNFDNNDHDRVIERRKKMISFFEQKYEVIYIEHPKRSWQERFNVKTIKMADIGDKFYESIFILDYPFHSFFYRAIYQSIPFKMIFDRNWLKIFSKDYNELIEFLNTKNYLFFTDELNIFYDDIDNYFKKKHNFYANLDVVDFFESKLYNKNLDSI